MHRLAWHGEASQSGFTLVEILVVVVVMAVGLLGGVALLLTGLRASRVAIQQTRAANLASDLGDRIRANPGAGAAYALDAGTRLGAPAKPCQAPGECASQEVAARDLYEWQQDALSALPDARASVRVSPADEPSSNVYLIELEWSQADPAADARFALVVQA